MNKNYSMEKMYKLDGKSFVFLEDLKVKDFKELKQNTKWTGAKVLDDVMQGASNFDEYEALNVLYFITSLKEEFKTFLDYVKFTDDLNSINIEDSTIKIVDLVAGYFINISDEKNKYIEVLELANEKVDGNLENFINHIK